MLNIISQQSFHKHQWYHAIAYGLTRAGAVAFPTSVYHASNSHVCCFAASPVVFPVPQELQVTPTSVAAAQQRFSSSMMSSLAQHHSTALASWGVGQEELQAAGQLLQCEPVLKLGLTLLCFLYTRCAQGC
jgi:hypothetical protein